MVFPILFHFNTLSYRIRNKKLNSEVVLLIIHHRIEILLVLPTFFLMKYDEV